jgi:cyanophycinase-like exopeptidase
MQPRVLVIMGSGETSPTMVTIHQKLLARVGSAPAVLLETPFGFQENASDISEKAVAYFRASVGREVTPIGLRAPADEPELDTDRALALVRAAGWLFAGPGSPSYALRQWRGTRVPEAVGDLLRRGGVAVFASAAACTLGRVAVPVYEIYKVGAEPVWVEGLDLLGELAGISAAVVPHYDNTEGGNHDTRFCYLGERRLRVLEDQLPDGVHVLGVDEHTALLIDLDAQTATVAGRGGVTARVHGKSLVWPTGTVLTLDELRAAVAGLLPVTSSTPAPDPAPDPVVEAATAPSSLGEATDAAEVAFAAAEAAADADAMVAAALGLESAIRLWSRDTNTSSDGSRATSVLRSLVVRLGAAAVAGLRDPAQALAPLVEPLVELRLALRVSKDFASADRVRGALAAGGVLLQDAPSGTSWSVVP